MKGNHNKPFVHYVLHRIVFNISKIQNETDEGGSRIPTKKYLIIMSKGNHNEPFAVFFCFQALSATSIKS